MLCVQANKKFNNHTPPKKGDGQKQEINNDMISDPRKARE